ncbi:putative mitochondrial translocase complex component [Tirmania nivea]|nr:putative mitochondrial translocase complex component [Tirmania nivea]
MFAYTALRSAAASAARSRQQFARNYITVGARQQQHWAIQGFQQAGSFRQQLPAFRRTYAQVPGDKNAEGEKAPESEGGVKDDFLSADAPEHPDTTSKPTSEPESAEATPPPPPPPPPPFGEDPHSRVLPGHGRGVDDLPKSAYISSVDRKREKFARLSFTIFFLMLGAGALYLSRDWDTEEEAKKHAEDAPSGYTPGLMFKRIRARINDITTYYEEPVFEKLLPDPLPAEYQPPYTLVLGLEDLLIHTEWDKTHGWRSAKRPGLDYFLGYLSMYYELVVFSDSPSHLVIPIAEKMGQYPGFITQFLSREATRYKDGKYIKDLSHLNRDLSKVIIVDTKKEAVEMQPTNAIIIKPWKGDPKDRELFALINVLEFIAAMGVPDVRPVIQDFGDKHIPTEFATREAVARKKFNERLAEEREKRIGDAKAGFMSSLLGMKSAPEKEKLQEKMLQDLIREKGQENYKRMMQVLEEQRPKHEAEEKQRQKEMAEASKTSLSKVLTGGK